MDTPPAEATADQAVEQKPLVIDGVTAEHDVAFKLKLLQPLEHGDNVITVLTFRPMKFKYLDGVPGVGTEVRISHLREAMAKQCAVPPSVLGEMCARDAKKALSLISFYMRPFQETGETP